MYRYFALRAHSQHLAPSNNREITLFVGMNRKQNLQSPGSEIILDCGVPPTPDKRYMERGMKSLSARLAATDVTAWLFTALVRDERWSHETNDYRVEFDEPERFC